MAKYYLQCGDLKTIVSSSLTPEEVCRNSIEKFMEDNKDSKNKSISTKISVSERGFMIDNMNYGQNHTYFFDVAKILDLT